jgi:DNA-directed RNA polymerase subunit RPC12/RpoP
MSPRFCGRCGQEAGAGAHPDCERALALEPPRFCPECGRRMVVQVTPTDWTARCSRDGELSHGRA